MTADTGDRATWMERLRKAAGSGEPVDLAPGIIDDEADPPDVGADVFARQLPAEDIRALLLEPDLRTDPRGLQVRGALVTGTLDLDHAKIPCRLVFTHCRFETAPIFEQATLPELVLESVALPGLLLRSARLTGDADLTGLRSTGKVSAQNIHIGGNLLLRGGNLSNPDGDAVSLDGADIAGSAFLDGLVADAEVRALAARIGSQLRLKGAHLSNKGGNALTLDGAYITGDAVLDGLVATGEVRASGAHIGGQLVLNGANLSNKGGNALTLDGADITGDAFLGGTEQADITGDAFLDVLVATGEVRARGAHIGGQLVLRGGKLSNKGGNALTLDGADITLGAFLNGMETTGEFRAVSARIDHRLVLYGAKLSNPDKIALNLSGATLGTLFLKGAHIAEGRIDFSFASIRILSVGVTKPDRGLPPLSSALGWTLGTVHGFLRRDWRSASAWLDTIDTLPRTGGRKEFESQPWKEMAKIYDQIGRPEDARRFRFWAARRTTRVAPWTSKLVRWPYAALVGYGYYPLIVIGWLAALWLTVLVLSCLNASAFTPSDSRASMVTITTNNGSERVPATGATEPPSNYPQFNEGLYAVDTAIPAAATGQTSAWHITGNTWLPGVFAAIKGFAWLLTALLLAGITGILRKD